jgi:hypothetical protein
MQDKNGRWNRRLSLGTTQGKQKKESSAHDNFMVY